MNAVWINIVSVVLMQIELLDCGPRSLLCSWTLSNLMICYWDELFGLSPNSYLFFPVTQRQKGRIMALRLIQSMRRSPPWHALPVDWSLHSLSARLTITARSWTVFLASHSADCSRSVLNAAAWLILSTRTSDHTTAKLHELHWLQIPEQIQFWLYVLSYCCLRRTAPLYLTADIFCQCTLFHSNNDNNNCDIALLRFLQLDMYIVLSAWICNFQLHFHSSSLESLHEHFDVDILPEELGGKLPATDELVKVKSWFSRLWYLPTLHASPCLFVCLFCHNSIG